MSHVPKPGIKPVQDSIELSQSGSFSSENGSKTGILSLFTSLKDVIQGSGELIAGTTETVFGTLNRIEQAKNPVNATQATATAKSSGFASSLPASVQNFGTTNNLLIIGGVGLGLAGVILAVRG